jgi:hypothetical protein
MLVIFVLFGHKIWNVDKFVYAETSLKCTFKNGRLMVEKLQILCDIFLKGWLLVCSVFIQNQSISFSMIGFLFKKLVNNGESK